MKKKLISALLALTIPVAMVNPAAAADKQVVEAQKEFNNQNLDQSLKPKAEDMEQALELIESIPDDVLLRGDKATQEWLENDPKAQEMTEEANFWLCAAAIGSMIASNVVGAGKLLKIKRLIKDLGGVVEAVKVMWGASFSYEKMQAAGGALGALASEFFGIDSVRHNCFG
jgi:whole genome shotgun sequence assembly, scaffold_89